MNKLFASFVRRYMKLLLILMTLILVSCSHHGRSTPEKTNVEITKNLTANSWGDIYFSAQPSNSDFKELQKEGFKTIINLRGKVEGDYKESRERKIIKKLGMNYYNVPFNKNDKMTDEYVEQVTSKVMENRQEGKVLIHCSSGNRVALWLGSHFKKDHGFSNERSLELAKKLGLTNIGVQKKLEAYLNK
tara:strand:+ start:96526 stop:97092 length:567 start_codon:yes stop_codon:yes gene_type:complete